MRLTHRSLVALSAVAALLLTACPPPDDNGDGDEMPDIAELFPADNEIGSWVEDSSLGGAGVEVGRSFSEAEAIVNGDADSFDGYMVAFAREYYTDGTAGLELRAYEMGDAAACTEAYDLLIVDNPLYSANTWDAASLGDAGRIADTGSHWFVNTRKKIFYVEAWIEPNDAPGKTAVESFVETVLEKIP